MKLVQSKVEKVKKAVSCRSHTTRLPKPVLIPKGLIIALLWGWGRSTRENRVEEGSGQETEENNGCYGREGRREERSENQRSGSGGESLATSPWWRWTWTTANPYLWRKIKSIHPSTMPMPSPHIFVY